MPYAIKEMYFTLQGEGVHAGRPAVFCRFSGCNLWTGRERDRPRAVCRFCDTDFVGTNGPGGGRFETAQHLAEAVALIWQQETIGLGSRFVVCTGGEPLLQLDSAAVRALHDAGFTVALETNGTIQPPTGIDWICVSPKAGTELLMRRGDELKLIYPQPGAPPENYVHLDFQHFVLQPMDGPDLGRNLEMAINYCLRHPQWRLGVQLHKLLGLREAENMTNLYHLPLASRRESVDCHENHQPDRYLHETEDAVAATESDVKECA